MKPEIREQLIQKYRIDLLAGETVEENYQSVLKFHHLSFIVKSQYAYDGMTKQQLENFKEVTGLLWAQIADLLMVTERTLYMKKAEDVLNQRISDQFLALVDFYSQLYNLYGDRETVNILLSSQVRGKGGLIPLEIMPFYSGRTYLLDTVFHFSNVNPDGNF